MKDERRRFSRQPAVLRGVLNRGKGCSQPRNQFRTLHRSDREPVAFRIWVSLEVAERITRECCEIGKHPPTRFGSDAEIRELVNEITHVQSALLRQTCLEIVNELF